MSFPRSAHRARFGHSSGQTRQGASAQRAPMRRMTEAQASYMSIYSCQSTLMMGWVAHKNVIAFMKVAYTRPRLQQRGFFTFAFRPHQLVKPINSVYRFVGNDFEFKKMHSHLRVEHPSGFIGSAFHIYKPRKVLPEFGLVQTARFGPAPRGSFKT